MRDSIVGLLDETDVAIAKSVGVIPEPDLEAVARLVADMRIRLSYPDSVVVVALAGGTGSGKSSLLNAVAGREVAVTGGVRPMTSSPMALVPRAQADVMERYMGEIGVSAVETYEGPPWLCLLDLPDTDSVEIEHRHQVEVLLPRLDLVAWVVDPEKYRDASLHRRFLRPLSGYQGQFIVILNQIDRLTAEELAQVEGDLLLALREDGIAIPRVVATSTQPASGPPMGIEGLVNALEGAIVGRRPVYEKLITDLRTATSRMLAVVSGGSGVDFEARWPGMAESVVNLMVKGETAEAGRRLTEFVEEMGDEVEGPVRQEIHALAPGVGDIVSRIVEDSRPQPPPRPGPLRRLMRREVPPAAEPDPVAMARRLDQELADPLRGLLQRRAEATAAIAELSLRLARDR